MTPNVVEDVRWLGPVTATLELARREREHAQESAAGATREAARALVKMCARASATQRCPRPVSPTRPAADGQLTASPSPCR
jgi:hypothetical protein